VQRLIPSTAVFSLVARVVLVSLVVLGTTTGCAVPADPCLQAVAADIDETLTTSDSEWAAQIDDPTHDPAERPDAATLMQGYDDLGYTVIYVTARDEGRVLSDGRTARQATADWLEAHGFPFTNDDLYLSPGSPSDAAKIAYKSGVLEDLAANGWTTDWAYGNAQTDVEAFLEAGVAPDHVFLVGKLAGSMDVKSIPDADAFAAHVAEQLPQIEPVACP
jgi:phosphatidate phosphatase PAH1